MPKTAANGSNSRLQRLEHCLWCGGSIPEDSRSDAEYCSGRHRYEAAMDRSNSGLVKRTTILTNGKISVVIHMDKATLRPGDQVKVGK